VIGEILGNRYKILRDLGSGGMARVYLAEDSTAAELVAVKVLYPQFSLDMAYLQRFVREAKVASALTSPHIVKVLDYGATRDVHYLVMEYIVGQNLRDLLNERHRLPWQEALAMARQVALALDHAFQFGIVHRDIKPQNLMVDPAGTVKVLDFGIARALTMPTLTLTGFVGSPYYISPEQAKGEQVDIRSDIYSLGVVLYEMISGKVPFDADNPWAIISQHIADVPPPLSADEPGVPPAVSELVLTALSKSKEDRFQTPVELIEAIDAILPGSASSPIEEGERLSTPAADLSLEQTYARGIEAAESGDWISAANLFSQILEKEPHFRDVKDQLAKAETQIKLDDLYQAALSALQNRRWADAVAKLSEILAFDMSYREASAFLNTARREIEREASVEAQMSWTGESQQLVTEQRPLLATPAAPRRSSRQWLLGILVFLLVGTALSVGGLELSARQREQSARIRYDRAIELFGQKKWEESIGEFERVLTLVPDYKDATIKKQAAVRAHELEQLYEQGRLQYEAGNVAEAINTLTQLRSIDLSFEQSSVSDMLCDSYYKQAVILSQDVDPKGLQGASTLLDKALEICPSSTDILAEKKRLEEYWRIVVDLQDGKWNQVLDRLSLVEKTLSGESDERIRKILYKVYFSFGQKREEEGNPAAALLHYQKAASIPGIDPAEAELKAREILARLATATVTTSVTAAPTPAATAAPTSTPRPAVTSAPSLSAQQSAVAGAENVARYYSPPRLVAPADASIFTSGRFAKIVLEWEGPQQLAEDEYYDVTVLHFFDGKEVYWGTNTRETQLELPPSVGYGEADKDVFHWFVTIRRAVTFGPDGKPDGPPISLRSEAWTFVWR
jgi:serine/threonine protein kinase